MLSVFLRSIIQGLVVIPYELSGRIGIAILFDLLTEIRQTAFNIVDLMHDQRIHIPARISELIMMLKQDRDQMIEPFLSVLFHDIILMLLHHLGTEEPMRDERSLLVDPVIHLSCFSDIVENTSDHQKIPFVR